MDSIKESPHSTIELLNDEEARQLLEFVQRLQKEKGVSLTFSDRLLVGICAHFYHLY